MQGKTKKIWSAALALLMITGLITSQSVLFAKDTEEEHTVTGKIENKEKKLNHPKIGRGGADAEWTNGTGCKQRKY